MKISFNRDNLYKATDSLLFDKIESEEEGNKLISVEKEISPYCKVVAKVVVDGDVEIWKDGNPVPFEHYSAYDRKLCSLLELGQLRTDKGSEYNIVKSNYYCVKCYLFDENNKEIAHYTYNDPLDIFQNNLADLVGLNEKNAVRDISDGEIEKAIRATLLPEIEVFIDAFRKNNKEVSKAIEEWDIKQIRKENETEIVFLADDEMDTDDLTLTDQEIKNNLWENTGCFDKHWFENWEEIQKAFSLNEEDMSRAMDEIVKSENYTIKHYGNENGRYCYGIGVDRKMFEGLCLREIDSLKKTAPEENKPKTIKIKLKKPESQKEESKADAPEEKTPEEDNQPQKSKRIKIRLKNPDR